MKSIYGLLAFLVAGTLDAEPSRFVSTVEQVTLLELYSSEGCSSCPSAERWLSKLTHDERLWTKVVPVGFHVDYWDYLGWRDRFGDARFTERQQLYNRLGYVKTSYTPGFMVNGREWRGYFYRRPLVPKPAPEVGHLSVEVNDDVINATFEPVNKALRGLQLNVALLGQDIRVAVNAGENDGSRLEHDFVVLAYQKVDAQRGNQRVSWTLDRDKLVLRGYKPAALAAWVTAADDPTPIQATGGWLGSVE